MSDFYTSISRYVSVSWSFYDLEQKIIYKAKQNQSTVIKVDPHYTSQCCPVFGHIEKANRNKKKHLFTCRNCGYQSNDDRIGAMNLYRMKIDYLVDSQVPNIDVHTRLEILRKDYDILFTKEEKSEVENMCTFSEAIESIVQIT